MPDMTEIVFRTIAVMAAVLLAALLLSGGRRRQAALPGALFCLAVAAFFVTSTPGADATLGPWGLSLTALCVTKAAWFWLFARALFNDDASFGYRQLSIVVAVAAAGTWQQALFLPAFRSDSATVLEIVAGFGFEGVLLVLVLAGLYEAWRDMAVDLVDTRRRLRFAFIGVTGAYLAATLGVQSYNLVMGVSTPLPARLANMTAAALACLTAGWFLLQLKPENWLDPGRTSRRVALSRLDAAVMAKLEKLLEADRVFIEEGLTIGALAARLGTGEHVLRRVINCGMGYRNFNDFLNAWRIREACEELARPEQARLPVLAIAMKVGYGSVGAFNRAFKARVGMTPTAFRRSNLNGASHSRG